jgi:N-methylhydantoinase A/oxoprolinase/acetone carboxylase beta subunit
VLSAVGLLTAPVQRDLVRSWPTPLDHAGLPDALAALAARATSLVSDYVDRRFSGDSPDQRGGVEVRVGVDCRYAGQSHELTVPAVEAFPDEHARRNGYRRDGHPIEVTALRASARVASPVRPEDLPPQPRAAVEGPTVVAEADCTIWVSPGWRAAPATGGALVLQRIDLASGVR